MTASEREKWLLETLCRAVERVEQLERLVAQALGDKCEHGAGCSRGESDIAERGGVPPEIARG